MKFIIFGGSGFIGSSVLDLLLKEGYKVRVFDRLPLKNKRNYINFENIEEINGDFSNIKDVSRALEGMDVVIHLISTTLPANSNSQILFDIESNLIPTIKLLNLMALKKSSLIFVSSGGTVYGNPIYLPINESHTTNPLVSYGVTKLSIESYMLLYKKLYGMDIKILRVSNPFGAGQNKLYGHGVIATFLSHMINNKTIEIWGDGSIQRDYLYITDLSRAIYKAIQYKGRRTVFNIGSGIGVSINELITIIEATTGLTASIDYKPSRTSDVKINILDCSLAKKELLWEPLVGLDEGILKIFNESKK